MKKGGEFFTPTSIVKLIVDVIEPFHGRIYDPACGSGGMFVQSAKFVERHKRRASSEIMVYGEDKTAETIRLCKMNLVNGVDKEKLKDDRRFPYGLPRPDNANYLWIQIFLSALNENGRAGFVMANSASDARQSELDIRQKKHYETVNILFRAASEKRGVLKEHFTQLTNLLLRWAHAIWKYYREQYREKKSFDVNKWLEKEKGCFRLDALIRSGCQ